MKQFFQIFLLTLGLLSCKNQTTINVNDKLTESDQIPTLNNSNVGKKYYQTDCDKFEIDNKFKIQLNSINLRVFVEACPVYCSPSETSKIIDTLFFNSQVRLIETIKSNNSEWLRIDNTQSLFIKRENLTLEPYNYLGYLIGTNISNKKRILELKSISDDNSRRIIDTYAFGETYSEIDIKNLPYISLYKTDMIIKFTETHNIDPTSYYYEFVIFNQNNKSFKKLVSYSSTYIDLCEYEEEEFYFPMKFENGKILLVKDADYENIFNYQTAELNTIEYPTQTNIQIEQLLIKLKRSAECITDKEGYQIFDPKTKNPKMKIIEDKPIYYRWDGQNLTMK